MGAASTRGTAGAASAAGNYRSSGASSRSQDRCRGRGRTRQGLGQRMQQGRRGGARRAVLLQWQCGGQLVGAAGGPGAWRCACAGARRRRTWGRRTAGRCTAGGRSCPSRGRWRGRWTACGSFQVRGSSVTSRLHPSMDLGYLNMCVWRATCKARMRLPHKVSGGGTRHSPSTGVAGCALFSGRVRAASAAACPHHIVHKNLS